MTADETKSIREDIAFMKTLADEGMSTPLVGGSIVMMFGAVFTLVNMIGWVGQRFMGLRGDWQLWLVGGAWAICTIGLPILIRRSRKQPGYHSPANIAFGNAWMAVGIAIGVLSGIVFAVCYQQKSGAPAMIFPSVVIALYAVGWTVTAAMTRQKFLWVVAMGSYLAACAAPFAWGQKDVNLYMAVIVFLIAFVPGTVLFLREPKSVI